MELFELAADRVEELAPGHVVAEFDGGGETLPVGAAVAFYHDPVETQEDAAIRLADIQFLAQAPEGVLGSEIVIGGNSPFAGAKVAALSPRLAQRLRVNRRAAGVAIIDIDRSSPAARFGFLPGDIVRDVNGVAIDKPETLASAADEDTRWWRFTIERNGQTIRQVLRF